MALFVVLQIFAPYFYKTNPNRLTKGILWINYLALGTFACLFFYTLAADLVIGLWKILTQPENDVAVEHTAFLVVSAMTLISVLFGLLQTVRGPQVYEVTVPIKDLPQQFEGFTIAQISDLHLGAIIGKKYSKKVTQLTNSLTPDVVALTGDFVDGPVSQLHHAAAPLAQLQANHGVFFVTGNHEYYAGAQQWINEFARLGMRVLLNEHVTIQKDDAELVLAGVTDPVSKHGANLVASNLQKSVQNAPSNTVKILLAHRPSVCNEAAKAGFQLQLSGHTHGGQFFPWSIMVKLAEHYYKGLYKCQHMWLYVNRGTGYWGPPLRFLNSAEITLLKLQRSPSA